MNPDKRDRAARSIAGKMLGLVLLAILVIALWASDQITLQGERTLFSANCEHGAFMEKHCTGKLVPAKRYAFRASRSRQEVLFWTRGTIEPSGKYTHCHVVNRDNWQCEPRADEASAVTHELEHGKPAALADSSNIAIHGVSKWKWYGMTLGIPWFTDADY